MKNHAFQLKIPIDQLFEIIEDKQQFSSGVIFAIQNQGKLSNLKYNIEDKIVIINKLQYSSFTYQLNSDVLQIASEVYFDNVLVQINFDVLFKSDNNSTIVYLAFANDDKTYMSIDAVRLFIKNFESYCQLSVEEKNQIITETLTAQATNSSFEYIRSRNHFAMLSYIIISLFLLLITIYGILVSPRVTSMSIIVPGIVRIVFTIGVLTVTIRRIIYKFKLRKLGKTLQ